jgi:iron complex outermembrane recepter protein
LKPPRQFELELGKSMRNPCLPFLCCAALVTDAAAGAAAEEGPLDAIVVTATRAPEPVGPVPADISLVYGPELEARDAWTMSQALSLVPGVEAPSGGDAGPSSAVPAFWGLHEFDAFLLVVDEVPWGGAFNPGITTLDFTDVQRIEVLKGSAPVMYGATSFVGVVHLLHYPAGEASNEADIAVGNYGSARGSAAFALPDLNGYRHSFAVDGQSLGFADPRENVSDGRVLYRGALDLGPGTLRIDADLTFVRDVPPSPIIRVGSSLTTLTPIDSNFNPADSKIDEDKYHLAVGYSLPTAAGTWDTLVSFAYSNITDIRAFLEPDLSGAADTQNQDRHIDDDYFDTHLTNTSLSNTTLIAGADLLYGRGTQTTLNGNAAYTVPLDGSVIPPPTTQLPVNEIGTIDDKRVFAGQYVQFDWKPDSRWDVLAGVRLNEAYEQKSSSDYTAPPPVLAAESVSKTIVRPSETIGVSYQVWAAAKDQFLVYADFRNTFKPSAIDFGPDYTPDLLSPETAQSYEAGLKGAAADGRLIYQAEMFLMNFNNLVVATSSGALANAAAEKLKGVEVETRFQMTPDLALAANASYHDAYFTQYDFFDGEATVNVAGRQLPLSPHLLAAAGLLYTPKSGFSSTVVAQYVGRRFLDEENIAPVGGYTNLAATLGYGFGHFAISFEGNNLTNQRPPVSASEFGSESFYLLPARTFWLRFRYLKR